MLAEQALNIVGRRQLPHSGFPLLEDSPLPLKNLA